MSRSSGRHWFRKSIVDCSVEISKSFADAKTRIQHGIERIKEKNVETFKRIPSFRGSFRGKSDNQKIKSPRKVKLSKKNKSPAISPAKSPPRSPSGRSLASTVNSTEDRNSTYRISRKPFLPSVDCGSFSSDSDFEEIYERVLRNTRLQLLNSSNSFPRVNHSRKVDNINIVFAKAFPSPNESSPSEQDCTSETLKNQSHYETCTNNLEPKTSTPKDQTHYESCCSNLSVIPKEKSAAEAMDNLRRTIAKIHAEKLMNPTRKSSRPSRQRRRESNLARSPASSLERYTSPDVGDSSDSELALSTDISCAESNDDEPGVLPALQVISAATTDVTDNDVYWIPRKIFNLPRTSSTLSVQARCTRGGGNVSPGISPIKNRDKFDRENQIRKAWGMTYKVVKKNKTSRQLFSIEETFVADSGYSDRSGVNSRATSSRATIHEQRITPSPTSSMTPSPTLLKEDETLAEVDQFYNDSQPFVLKSFYV